MTPEISLSVKVNFRKSKCTNNFSGDIFICKIELIKTKVKQIKIISYKNSAKSPKRKLSPGRFNPGKKHPHRKLSL